MFKQKINTQNFKLFICLQVKKADSEIKKQRKADKKNNEAKSETD